jgi:predicted acetyltransferase
MFYRLPRIEDEEILRDYVQEHYENGETSITASDGLTSMAYSEWVEKIRRNAEEGDETYGKSLLLLCMDESRLIGLLSVRYELSREQSEVIGDIGYGVRPSQRKKGYASAMLKHALDICRDKGKKQVIVGCYKDNLASAKTIQKNGGILLFEKDNFTKGRLSQYYMIHLH